LAESAYQPGRPAYDANIGIPDHKMQGPAPEMPAGFHLVSKQRHSSGASACTMRRGERDRRLSAKKRGFAVSEGIFALNERLAEDLPYSSTTL
jgi:hypothetical protein